MDQAEKLRQMVRLQQLTQAVPAKQSVHTRIIAVTSGKGGVGKTNITLNLAIAMAKEHHKKILVLDADLGTANIDIVLGIFPKFNISHLLLDEKPMEDVVVEGPYGVKILPGVSGMADLTSITEKQKELFFSQLEAYQEKHQLDYILVDTGAGLGHNVINFLLASDEMIVVMTTEPTSLSDAYAIIKVVHQYNKDQKISIVVNMVPSEAVANRMFGTIQSVSDKFLGKTLNFLGYLTFDRTLSSAVRQQKPIVLSYPNSGLSLEIYKLSHTLVNIVPQTQTSIRSFFEIAGKYFGWNHD